MAKTVSKPCPCPEDDAILAGLDLNKVVASTPAPAISPASLEQVRELAAPEPGDPAWPDHVLAHLNSQEQDSTGKPRIHGLRRLVRLLLGPILESRVEIVQVPQLVQGWQQPLTPAVARATLRVLVCRLPGREPYEMVVEAVADCGHLNSEPEFTRFAVALAETRAKARALREALLVPGVAAEECTGLPALDLQNENDSISPSQVQLLDFLCQRLNIDAWKFVNMGTTTYRKVADIPHEVAVKMLGQLNSYQQKLKPIPDSLRGYRSGWNRLPAGDGEKN